MSKHKKRDKAEKKLLKKSGSQRVLELLSDGRVHSHHEIYGLRVVGHSRIAELRRRGHRISCERSGDTYWFRLERAA